MVNDTEYFFLHSSFHIIWQLSVVPYLLAVKLSFSHIISMKPFSSWLESISSKIKVDFNMQIFHSSFSFCFSCRYHMQKVSDRKTPRFFLNNLTGLIFQFSSVLSWYIRVLRYSSLFCCIMQFPQHCLIWIYNNCSCVPDTFIKSWLNNIVLFFHFLTYSIDWKDCFNITFFLKFHSKYSLLWLYQPSWFSHFCENYI